MDSQFGVFLKSLIKLSISSEMKIIYFMADQILFIVSNGVHDNTSFKIFK
jgi:hypothetical protein